MTNLSLFSTEHCYKVCFEFSIDFSTLSKQNLANILCSFVTKEYQYILLSYQLMKSCLPPEWSSDGHVLYVYEIFCSKISCQFFLWLVI